MKTALRLRRPADFARVRRYGKLYRSPALLLSVCANELSHNRYGFVAGKTLGIAVIRNRCKRRLRAAVSLLHGELKQGFDIVIIPRRQLLGQPFAELQRILRRLFSRAQLIGSS